MSPDEQAIRELVDTWMRATLEGDLNAILPLMSEDVIFLRPGHEPMVGRDAFAASFQALPANALMNTSSHIHDLTVVGDVAWLSNELHISFTPVGQKTIVRNGRTLTIFRKNAEGRWQLIRDANMMMAQTEEKPTLGETVHRVVDRAKDMLTGPGPLRASNSFTPRAQQVLVLARKEANRFHHNYVSTEHLLLGLIVLGQGVAVNVLKSLNLDLELVRREVVNQVGEGPEAAPSSARPPYTPRFKKALALAAKEAKNLGHSYVGTEHLLLGLLRENGGAAARVLTAFNLDAEQTRAMILKELDPNYDPATDATSAHPRPAINFSPRAEMVVSQAKKEMQPFGAVLSDNIFLAIIRLGQGTAVHVLQHLKVDLEKLRVEIESKMGQPQELEEAPAEARFSPRVEKIFAAAAREAESLGHLYVGTEHLLLGLLTEGHFRPLDTLIDAGVNLEVARAQVLKELDPEYSKEDEEGDSSISFRGMPDQLDGSLRSINFSAPAQQVLVTAMIEARHLGHNYVSSDCLFLALAHMGPGPVLKVLQKMQVDLDPICREIELKMGTGAETQEKTGGAPYTPRTKKVLLRASQEAATMGHHEVGPEHILLGLLAESGSICVGLLKMSGVTFETARERVLKELNPADAPKVESPAQPSEEPFSAPASGKTTSSALEEKAPPFSPRAQQVLALALKEARQRSHNIVGSFHLYLGVIKLGQGVAFNVLRAMGVDVAALRQEIDAKIGQDEEDWSKVHQVPYTARARDVLANAAREARSLGHGYVGSEHILLGLLTERPLQRSLATLEQAGVTLDRARILVLKELNPDFEPQPEPAPVAPITDPFYIEKAAPIVPVDDPGSGQEARINGPIVEMKLTNEPLGAPGLPEEGESGAIVDFYGVVRNQEAGRPLAALDYEAYEPMARRELEIIVRRLAIASPCHSVHLTHRLGVVPVGEPSLHVRVRARHRAEAFAMASALIDEMKLSVPIWKKAVFAPFDAPPEENHS